MDEGEQSAAGPVPTPAPALTDVGIPPPRPLEAVSSSDAGNAEVGEMCEGKQSTADPVPTPPLVPALHQLVLCSTLRHPSPFPRPSFPLHPHPPFMLWKLISWRFQGIDLKSHVDQLVGHPHLLHRLRLLALDPVPAPRFSILPCLSMKRSRSAKSEVYKLCMQTTTTPILSLNCTSR
jgi:hypothetical protein